MRQLFPFYSDMWHFSMCRFWPWRIVLVRPKGATFQLLFLYTSLPKKVFSYFFIPFPLASSSNVVSQCLDLTQIRRQGHSGKSSLFLAQTYQTYQVPLCTAKTAHLDPFKDPCGTPESRSPTFCLRFFSVVLRSQSRSLAESRRGSWLISAKWTSARQVGPWQMNFAPVDSGMHARTWWIPQTSWMIPGWYQDDTRMSCGFSEVVVNFQVLRHLTKHHESWPQNHEKKHTNCCKIWCCWNRNTCYLAMLRQKRFFSKNNWLFVDSFFAFLCSCRDKNWSSWSLHLGLKYFSHPSFPKSAGNLSDDNMFIFHKRTYTPKLQSVVHESGLDRSQGLPKHYLKDLKKELVHLALLADVYGSSAQEVCFKRIRQMNFEKSRAQRHATDDFVAKSLGRKLGMLGDKAATGPLPSLPIPNQP